MRTTLALLILAAAVIGGGYYFFGPPSQAAAPQAAPAVTNTVSATATAATSSTTSAPDSYTLAQVAQHGSSTSCWSAINGNVYDLTSWIDQHPGGEGAILEICGKDGSEAFNGQHGNDGRAQSELATFKIGALAS